MTLSRRAFGFSAAALAIVAAAPASAQSNLSAEDQATLRQAQAYLTALTAALKPKARRERVMSFLLPF